MSVHSVGPMGSNGRVKCLHDIDAALRTSHTEKNPGRQFYCCSLSERCQFWYWADDPALPRLSRSPPNTQKRSRSPVEAETSPSQRRFALIQQALSPPGNSNSHRLQSPSQPSRAQSQRSLDLEFPLSPPSQPRHTLTPPRQVSSKDSDTDSFFSLPFDINAFTTPPPIRPSTPPDARTFKRARTDDGSSTLLTPPPTIHTLGLPSASRHQLPTNDSDRQISWPTLTDDPENPFHQRAASQPLPRLLSPPPPSEHSTKQPTEPTVESITAMAEAFAYLPPYVRKLERKRLAAEKSSEAKVTRIKLLEDENMKLKKRVKYLEDILDSVKATLP